MHFISRDYGSHSIKVTLYIFSLCFRVIKFNSVFTFAGATRQSDEYNLYIYIYIYIIYYNKKRRVFIYLYISCHAFSNFNGRK